VIDATAAAFALLLGAVAAFNPCGFALLPAYITAIVTGSSEASMTRPQSLRRGVIFGLAMTAGFVAVFTGFGLLFGAVNVALQGSVLPYLPYVTVSLGVVLIGFGIAMALGHEVPGLRVRPMTGRAPRADAWSQVLYGVSFALASLSCTIAPFFAVVTQSLDASGPVGAIAPFVIYGAGMGTPVLVTLLGVVTTAVLVVFAMARRDSRQAGAEHASPATEATAALATSAPITATPDVLDAIRRAAQGQRAAERQRSSTVGSPAPPEYGAPSSGA